MNDFEMNIKGGHKSPIDYRDIYVGSTTSDDKQVEFILPKEFFNDISKIPVVWQKKIGCCGGCASSYLKESVDFTDVNLSFRFAYAIAKCIDNFPDEGTYTRTLGQVFKNYGCATELTCFSDANLPHETFVYQRKLENIPTKAMEEAKENKIDSYGFVNVKDENAFKKAIVDGGFVLLLQLGEEWWKNKKGVSSWKEEDILPLRAPKTVVSGHFVYVYGYDAKYIYFLNSWSTNWGKKGIGYFSYKDHKPFLIEGLTFHNVPKDKVEEVKNLEEKFYYVFLTDMQFGERSHEVLKLQQFLKSLGLMTQTTGYYGDLTREAVLTFQKKYNVTTLTENLMYRGKYFGKKSRTKANELIK
jgi:hypothetical protein